MTADVATPAQATPPAVLGSETRIDRAFEWLGERLNPILVKEARQALKSRQFLMTFGLLLIAAWGWSLIGLVIMGDTYSVGQAGPTMFMGYFCILIAAIGVFVPFGAFRSLAVEQEDRTYELLSITGLSPRQIVSGKLGSAIVQMLLHLSALTPCLAFTYMLRGISLPMIIFVLTYTILGSIGLSMIGLFLGTLTTERHWQVLLSVVMIVGLLSVFFPVIGWTGLFLFDASIPFDDTAFWLVCAMFLTAYVTYFALAFYAAVAQITFTSDNRSTKLRVVMLVQQICLAGWFMFAEDFDDEAMSVLILVAAFHWAIMGALMTGEWPELSMRVKRRLPQSFLGRMFLTWFNPGPGTGYVFACGGAIAASLTATALLFVGLVTGEVRSLTAGGFGEVFAIGILAPAYVTAYLGTGLLLVRFLRRFTQASLFLAALIQVMLVTAGTAAPFVIESIISAGRFSNYSLLHITNPFWTVGHAAFDALPGEAHWLIALVAATASLVFALNLPGILHEVRQTRVARPTRVAEEDELLAAEKSPPVPVQISPWDRV